MNPNDETPYLSPDQQTSVRTARTQRKAMAIIITGVVLVLATGVVYLLVSRNHHPAPLDEERATEQSSGYDNSKFTSEVTTTVSDNGFSPSTLAIKPHTRVNWQNADAKAYILTMTDTSLKDTSAARDNDSSLPNHTVIAAQGGYAHVFEKPGTYTLHLVDQPTANITIIVK